MRHKIRLLPAQSGTMRGFPPDPHLRQELRGFWDDVLQIGEDAARKKLQDLLKTTPVKKDKGELTAEQNRVTDVLLANVLDRYNAGQLSSSQATRELRRIAAEYEEFALPYGTRGRNGANDVNTLVRQLVADIGSGTTGGGTNGSGGIWRPTSFGGLSPGALLLGGGALLVLANSGRRRR